MRSAEMKTPVQHWADNDVYLEMHREAERAATMRQRNWNGLSFWERESPEVDWRDCDSYIQSSKTYEPRLLDDATRSDWEAEDERVHEAFLKDEERKATMRRLLEKVGEDVPPSLLPTEDRYVKVQALRAAITASRHGARYAAS